VTPNAVTFGGVSLDCGGHRLRARRVPVFSVGWSVVLHRGLFDEMDGMLARINFAESPRGTWLEGFADGLSYLLLFGGITIGLSHRYGRPAVLMGILLLVGAIQFHSRSGFGANAEKVTRPVHFHSGCGVLRSRAASEPPLSSRFKFCSFFLR
jgi:phosphatidylglycerophosphate synthase